MRYKGWELMKAISDGEIKEGSKFKAEYETFIARDGYLFIEYDNRQKYASSFELKWEFELIEDEIDIDNIEELNKNATFINGRINDQKIIDIQNKTNELVQAVKQLNNKIN